MYKVKWCQAHFLYSPEGSHTAKYFLIAGLRADMRIPNLPNTKQER
jgi:hypothetical protein